MGGGEKLTLNPASWSEEVGRGVEGEEKGGCREFLSGGGSGERRIQTTCDSRDVF